MKVIVVDILDLWSIGTVLLHCRRGCKLYYLLVYQGIIGKIIIWIISLFGCKSKQLDIYFAEKYSDLFQKNDNSTLNFMLDYIEPIWKNKLQGLGKYTEKEIQYISRCVMKDTEPFASRIYELIKYAKVLNCNVTLLIQHSFLLPAIVDCSRGSRVVVKGYYAPGRLNVPLGRHQYYEGMNGNPSLLYGVYSLYKSIIMIVPGCLVAFWRYIWRCGLNNVREKYDIIALVNIGSHVPTPEFNTLFWSEYFRKGNAHKIFAVYKQKSVTEYWNKFHLQRANRFESINHYALSFYHFRDKKSPTVAGVYLIGVIRFFFYVFIQVIKRKIPLLLAAQLLELENCVLFYASIMKMTGARLAWSMIEGNSKDSVAMTLAADRLKGVCLGTTWSLYPYADYSASIARNHILFVWGKHHREIFKMAKALPLHYVESGYPSMKCLDGEQSVLKQRPSWMTNALVAAKKKYVVTFYDNVCGFDLHDRALITCKDLRKLYSALLDWLDARIDVLLIVKTKRQIIFNDLDCEIRGKIKKFVKNRKLLIRETKADIEAGLGSDVVLGQSFSSLACLSAAHGKRCVLYNPNKLMSDNFDLFGLSSIVQIRNIEKLHSVLDLALNLPRDTDDRGGYIDSFADDKGDERISNYMCWLLEGYDRDLSRENNIKQANQLYAKAWGKDKIFNSATENTTSITAEQ